MIAIDHIRLSQSAKEQLVKLKRVTGIKHWNELCRWAFCISISEHSVPATTKIPTDSNVEMSWKVFGGRYADIYMAMLKERCIQDGLDTKPEILIQQFRIHLHRGIAYLAGSKNMRSIDDLVSLALRSRKARMHKHF